jgi:hypothetical protein
MNAVKWVLIDYTKGATTKDGKSKLSHEVLEHIAEAVQNQVNEEFAAEWGAHATIRVAKHLKDVRRGECAYVFYKSLPDDSDDSAYHDIKRRGVPYAVCAVSTCTDLYGPDGVSVDASHEILETAGDEGANEYAQGKRNMLHALEMCDAVEVQTYGKMCQDGTVVQVSNWLLRSWFNPQGVRPYDYMSRAGLPGAVSPPGPLRTAPGKGGNYQIVAKLRHEKEVDAMTHHIRGKRRKGKPHASSRAAWRLRNLAKLLASVESEAKGSKRVGKKLA